MVGYFIGVYIVNRTLHGCLEIRNFSTLEKKFRISVRPCNILYIFMGSVYSKMDKFYDLFLYGNWPSMPRFSIKFVLNSASAIKAKRATGN